MPPLAEHGIRQKLKVTILVHGLFGWEERPPPPPSSSCSRQLLNDEERHQGQNNRIEAIVPVSIALAGAAAAPAAVSESGGIHSLAILAINLLQPTGQIWRAWQKERLWRLGCLSWNSSSWSTMKCPLR